MWALLAVVAVAAAVLSFSALRDLAVLCGFSTGLAWLLPLVIDAGAAAGCMAWLRPGQSPGRGFARSLTWVLLASSVAGNAVVHALTAYQLRPAWWLVVAVSAVAPAVLGAVVHLAVLVGRPAPAGPGELPGDPGEALGDVVTESEWEQPPHVANEHGPHPAWLTAPPAVVLPGDSSPAPVPDRATELIAAGAGRRTLSRELGVSEHEARQLLTRSRNGTG